MKLKATSDKRNLKASSQKLISKKTIHQKNTLKVIQSDAGNNVVVSETKLKITPDKDRSLIASHQKGISKITIQQKNMLKVIQSDIGDNTIVSEMKLKTIPDKGQSLITSHQKDISKKNNTTEKLADKLVESDLRGCR